jgi:hypothetical protein
LATTKHTVRGDGKRVITATTDEEKVTLNRRIPVTTGEERILSF